MNRWSVVPNKKGSMTLRHKNGRTGEVQVCGDERLDTPKTMMIDWMMNTDAWRVGDIMVFADGDVVLVMEAATC